MAIWLGTKEELIALGIWDEEYFQPMRAFVEKGMNILEIRKEGLNFQSLSTFINLDEIAVTRVSDVHNRAAEVYKELSLQIDKKYGFHNRILCGFNVGIVCSPRRMPTVYG